MRRNITLGVIWIGFFVCSLVALIIEVALFSVESSDTYFIIYAYITLSGIAALAWGSGYLFAEFMFDCIQRINSSLEVLFNLAFIGNVAGIASSIVTLYFSIPRIGPMIYGENNTISHFFYFVTLASIVTSVIFGVLVGLLGGFILKPKTYTLLKK